MKDTASARGSRIKVNISEMSHLWPVPYTQCTEKCTSPLWSSLPPTAVTPVQLYVQSSAFSHTMLDSPVEYALSPPQQDVPTSPQKGAGEDTISCLIFLPKSVPKLLYFNKQEEEIYVFSGLGNIDLEILLPPLPFMTQKLYQHLHPTKNVLTCLNLCVKMNITIYTQHLLIYNVNI